MDGTSFQIGALRRAAGEGTITDRGLSWLLGYDRAQIHAAYVDSYGGDMDEVGDVPSHAPDVDAYRTGWAEGLSDHEQEESVQD